MVRLFVICVGLASITGLGGGWLAAAAPVYEIVREAPASIDASAGGTLTRSPDGSFYGFTRAYGYTQAGVIYKLTANGSYTEIFNFSSLTGATRPTQPSGQLLLSSDGALYGTTRFGGAWDAGTLFRVTSAGSFAVVGEFRGSAFGEGSEPGGRLLQGPDGAIYGAAQGGNNGFGVIYRYKAGAGLTKFADFTDTGSWIQGSSPSGIVLGPDGNFYGTTATGGIHRCGTFFRLTPGGTLTTIFHFKASYPGWTGGNPVGTLALGPDGRFYGTTLISTTPPQGGGLLPGGSVGTIASVFRIGIDGDFTTLAIFDGPFGRNPGSWPGDLLLGADGNFYGTTAYGDSDRPGTVFRISPDGVLSTLLQFTGAAGPYPGGNPSVGGLTLGVDGKMYGTTEWGGSASRGLVYRIGFDAMPETLDWVDATTNSLKVRGAVYPNGQQTAVSFEYGPTEALGSETAPIYVNQASGALVVSMPLTGLASNLIHYRIKTTSSAGTSIGQTRLGQTQYVPPRILNVGTGTTRTLTSNDYFTDANIQGTLDTAGRTISISGTLKVVPGAVLINNSGLITYLKRTGPLPPGRINLAYVPANDVADDDSDGRNNLLEFALGSDPSVPDVFGTPVISKVDGKLRLTHSSPAGLRGIVATAESSGDLRNWQRGEGATQVISDTTTNGWRTVVTEDLGVSGFRAMRLSVEHYIYVE